jgi:patatin-like phospholipase/acyl hydrolase
MTGRSAIPLQKLKRRPARGEWLTDPDYYMRDVARASAAAPTYFPPALIRNAAHCSPAIDDAGRKNLGCLAALADRMIALNDAALDEVCGKLSARKTAAVTVR